MYVRWLSTAKKHLRSSIYKFCKISLNIEGTKTRSITICWKQLRNANCETATVLKIFSTWEKSMPMAKSHLSQSLTVHVVMMNSIVKCYGNEVLRLSSIAKWMAYLPKNHTYRFQRMLTTYLSGWQLCFRKRQFQRTGLARYPLVITLLKVDSLQLLNINS